jgi:hypothetical protein
VRPLAALALATAVLAFASPSAADVEIARKLFAEGVQRFQKGDFEGARRLFEDADREHHSPVIDYNLALAEERLGHLQAAVEGYERYLAQAGEEGEFAQPATIALAQIRARSGRVHVRSQPPGGRVFVNGWPIRERTPTSIYVPPGHHLVVVEFERDRQSADVDLDSGQTKSIELVRAADGGSGTIDAPVGSARDLSGVVWGASFQVVPYGFFSSTRGDEGGATGIFVGLSADVGYAFTRRAVIGLRAYGSVGSECKQVFDSHIASLGPMLQIRAYDSLWIGAGLYGGNGETCRLRDNGITDRYTTDIVFSPVFDLSYAVTSQKYGQWLVSVGLGYFFATPSNDNRLIYAPIGFGPRFFSGPSPR